MKRKLTVIVATLCGLTALTQTGASAQPLVTNTAHISTDLKMAGYYPYVIASNGKKYSVRSMSKGEPTRFSLNGKYFVLAADLLVPEKFAYAKLKGSDGFPDQFVSTFAAYPSANCTGPQMVWTSASEPTGLPIPPGLKQPITKVKIGTHWLVDGAMYVYKGLIGWTKQRSYEGYDASYYNLKIKGTKQSLPSRLTCSKYPASLAEWKKVFDMRETPEVASQFYDQTVNRWNYELTHKSYALVEDISDQFARLTNRTVHF